ncbi:MAG: hypothetical protein L6V95_06515 [Candidatus Melainabacteria bacterium]|nr:MAG: hypothetical protein L6V95_06515 [Candidatus Melainabacteria bacterium]
MIYTTNEIGGKGVTVVKNNDFENLIKTANEQEGFKKTNNLIKFKSDIILTKLKFNLKKLLNKLKMIK